MSAVYRGVFRICSVCYDQMGCRAVPGDRVGITNLSCVVEYAADDCGPWGSASLMLDPNTIRIWGRWVV